jgi:hypothetical protein
LATARVLWWNSSLQEPEKAKEFQKKREREIRRIKRKEDLSRMHRRVGFTLRPDQERGGLNRIDVHTSDQQRPFPHGPDPKEWQGSWTTLTMPSDIATHVCAANQRQYHQAHTTPFGTEPLASYVGYKADTPRAEDIVQGKPLPPEVQHRLLPETLAIFNTLRNLVILNIPQHLPFPQPNFKSVTES